MDLCVVPTPSLSLSLTHHLKETKIHFTGKGATLTLRLRNVSATDTLQTKNKGQAD